MIEQKQSLKNNNQFKELYRKKFFETINEIPTMMSRLDFTDRIREGLGLGNESSFITAIKHYPPGYERLENIKEYENIFRIDKYSLPYNPFKEEAFMPECLLSFSEYPEYNGHVVAVLYERKLIKFVLKKQIDSQNLQRIKKERDFGTMKLNNIQRQSNGVLIPLSQEEQEELKKIIENPILREVKKVLLEINSQLEETKLLEVSKEIIGIGTETGFSKNKFTCFATNLFGFDALKQQLKNINQNITNNEIEKLANRIDYILKNQMAIEILNAIKMQKSPEQKIEKMTAAQKLQLKREKKMTKEELTKNQIEKIKSYTANHKTKKKDDSRRCLINLKTKAQQQFEKEAEEELKEGLCEIF